MIGGWLRAAASCCSVGRCTCLPRHARVTCATPLILAGDTCRNGPTHPAPQRAIQSCRAPEDRRDGHIWVLRLAWQDHSLCRSRIDAGALACTAALIPPLPILFPQQCRGGQGRCPPPHGHCHSAADTCWRLIGGKGGRARRSASRAASFRRGTGLVWRSRRSGAAGGTLDTSPQESKPWSIAGSAAAPPHSLMTPRSLFTTSPGAIPGCRPKPPPVSRACARR